MSDGADWDGDGDAPPVPYEEPRVGGGAIAAVGACVLSLAAGAGWAMLGVLVMGLVAGLGEWPATNLAAVALVACAAGGVGLFRATAAYPSPERVSLLLGFASTAACAAVLTLFRHG